MSKTKSELCTAAFRRAKISGITSKPTGDELAGAVELLEDLMRELLSKNAVTTYTYEDEPLLETDSNLDKQWYNAVQNKLAVMLCNDYGINASPQLIGSASSGWTSMIGKLTIPNMNSQPNRMPRGSGNRYPLWTRYYQSPSRAPIESSTLPLTVGETTEYTVSFDTYVTGTETVSSYIIEDVTAGITLNSDSLTNPDVTINVTGSAYGAQSLVIKITTSLGRVYPHKVWFNVSEV